MSLVRIASLVLVLALAAACTRLAEVGVEPAFTPEPTTPDRAPDMLFGVPQGFDPTPRPTITNASLWNGDRGSLLGERRAMQRGDILTVVVEINDSARISNQSDRARTGSQTSNIGALYGVPEMIDLAGDASLAPGVAVDGASSFSGNGSVRRNEQLTLRIAATVVEVLPNGVLSIEGSQQVRVNFELRELLVSGFVRPEDITRQNEISYDKIASARISYGGRGQITDVQQPRYGQQVTELLLPF